MPDTTGKVRLWWKLCIAVTMLAAITLTNPIGDFPLNDDWAWGKDVSNALAGDWQYSGWEAMPLLPQIVCGTIISKIFHFDYTILRLMVLALAYVAIAFFFETVFLLTKSVVISGIASLMLLFNPFFYALSFTFMTDIPFLALLSPSIYYFLRYVETGEETDLGRSITLCCLAALQRQLAVVVGVSYAVALAYRDGLSRKTLPRLVLSGLGPYFCLVAYESLLAATGKTPFLYLIRNAELKSLLSLGLDTLLPRIARRLLFITLSCGLLFFPLALFSFFSDKTQRARRFRLAIYAGFLLTISYVCLLWPMPIPFYGNILTQEGFGPFLLKDMYILALDHYPKLPTTVLFLATGLGLLGAATLLAVLADRAAALFFRGARDAEQTIFVFACAMTSAYSIVVTLFAGFYDRYLLINFLPLPALIFYGPSRRPGKALLATACAWLLIMAWFSVSAQHDYLAWNRTKWDALGYLEREIHASPEMIDGGFEYNASHFFNPGFRPRPGKSWWWVQDDKYLVAMAPVDGFKVLQAFPYVRTLHGDTGRIYVLERTTPQE